MKNKYIAFFCPQIYPCTTGGLEIYTYFLAKEISNRKKILLFTECYKINLPNIQIIKIRSRLFIIRRFYFGALSSLFSIIFALFRLKKEIEVFHVPHTSNADALGLIFPIIKMLFNIEYILVLHGGGMKPWGRYSLNSFLFKNAKRIITVSEPMKQEYLKRTNKSIDVIPSIIPFARSKYEKNYLKLKYNFNEKDKIIIMVGSIKTLKGNDIVLNVFINLGEKYIEENNLHLVFAGTGFLENELKDITEKSEFVKKIHFLGKIKNELIHEVYAIADIYVIASWYESLSKTLLEAMCNSLPIIATDVEGIRFSIKNNESGLVFEKNNPLDLSNKLKLLIEKPGFGTSLGKNAKRVFEERYNFSEVCNQMLEVYNSTSKE